MCSLYITVTVQMYRHQCTLSPPWRHPAACPAHLSSWPWPSPWLLTSRSRHRSWTRCCRWSAPSCPHVSPAWEPVFTYYTKANLIFFFFFCNYSIIYDNKRYPHLKFFIGNTAWAAATTTRAVSAVLIVVLLRVLLGTREAPPADGSSQRVAFQLQILLSWSSDVMKKNAFLSEPGRVIPLTPSFSRSSLICWCSWSVSSWSPSWSYLAKMAWISASVWPFLRGKEGNVVRKYWRKMKPQSERSFLYPFRSWRSSSKFNLPPACRRVSVMSSTAVFFSLSFIKALLHPWERERERDSQGWCTDQPHQN